jgi:hypothetical protein
VLASHRTSAIGNRELRVTRLDEEGTRTDTPMPYHGARIELIGQSGTAYVHDRQSTPPQSVAKRVVNVRTMQTTWTLPLAYSWLAASPDGGAMVQNASGQLCRFSAEGQLIGTCGASFIDPVQHKDAWMAVAGGRFESYVGPFADATRYDATYRQLNPAERRRFGNAPGSSAQSKPGTGIHVKVHNVAGVLPQ